MVCRRSQMRIWRLLLHVELFAAVLVASYAEERESEDRSSDGDHLFRDSHGIEKKYLAALAKNGRLPKFIVSQTKREESEQSQDNVRKDLNTNGLDEDWVEEKRHVGAFLKTHGKPVFSSVPASRRSGTSDDNIYIANPDSDVLLQADTDKRNVATLAKLGRLNAVGYSRFQPDNYGGKKRVSIYSQEMSDGVSKEENKVPEDVREDDCEDEGKETASNDEDNYTHPNWIQSQKKRYVAALARSGRLPVWHTQRMWWGGKRDVPKAYWLRYRSGARPFGYKRQIIDGPSLNQVTSRRCKKAPNVLVEDKSIQDEKWNMAMLARNGMLPNRV